ncbi:MAG: T9SS type A sorting domain-containing protein, partial [Muribaculaceae bacterium]|nr:T9SS type A sorting domain-containing protein [Muribaculaceae bacterium]
TSIDIDEVESKITVNSDDADNIEWIYSTHRTVKSSPSSTQSTVVGLGKTFDFSNFQGSYVRARLTNKFGETATQPFGFAVESGSTKEDGDIISEIAGHGLTVYADRQRREVTVESTEAIDRVSVVNAAGSVVMFIEADGGNRVTFSTADLSAGVYVVVAANDYSAYTGKFINR